MIPAEAVEAAAKAVYQSRVDSVPVEWSEESGRATAERDAHRALEAAAPYLGLSHKLIADTVREHWVATYDHPHYASAVRCMKDGCAWEGQFPGDISEHVADLLTVTDAV